MTRHRFASVAALTQLRAVGEAATYAPKSGAPIQIQAIIREATEVLTDGEAPVATYTPTARIARSAVAQPREGDRLIVGTRVWRVREVQDHQGALWLLFLNEARGTSGEEA
jgi:hypothetical protein